MTDGPDPAPLPGSARRRFEAPLERATAITRRTLEWFPVRVWRHFLQHNGFLLAAGVSYQSLFAIFAAIYLAFAAVGIWLGGSASAVRGLIDLVNRYVPDLISDNGLVTPEQVAAVASGSSGLLTATGVVAIVVVIWTAIGFVTYARRAVRDTFGLPVDRRSYLILKARDLLAAALFGLGLLVGAALSSVTAGVIDLVVELFGISRDPQWTDVVTRAVSLLIAFGVNALALASLFRFLAGASLSWRRIWPGAVLGAAATVVLQVGASFLVVYTPANPLLATFAIFIGFLLLFRLIGIVLLVAAAWIAVAAADRDETLESPADIEATERAALVVAMRVKLRDAERGAATAPWYRRPSARRRLQTARHDLAEAERAAAAVKAPSLPWD